MNYAPKTLWNYITQPVASKVSQNMYKLNEDKEAEYIESDLVNSYAWDTAIVYIQAMDENNKNYANQKDGNGTLRNTGTTEDEKSHIFDMAGNIFEWTTEYSTNASDSINYPCVHRGGYYKNSDDYTAIRYYDTGDNSYEVVGFRPLLYLK